MNISLEQRHFGKVVSIRDGGEAVELHRCLYLETGEADPLTEAAAA